MTQKLFGFSDLDGRQAYSSFDELTPITQHRVPLKDTSAAHGCIYVGLLNHLDDFLASLSKFETELHAVVILLNIGGDTSEQLFTGSIVLQIREGY